MVFNASVPLKAGLSHQRAARVSLRPRRCHYIKSQDKCGPNGNDGGGMPLGGGRDNDCRGKLSDDIALQPGDHIQCGGGKRGHKHTHNSDSDLRRNPNGFYIFAEPTMKALSRFPMPVPPTQLP